ASRNQRLVNGRPAPWESPTIMVGGRESYEARCRHCHKVPRADEDQTALLLLPRCEMRDAGCVVAHAHPPSRIPHPAVLNIGLTGNIAAGKSTVVDLFQRWGATIIDADALVREAQAPGGDVLAAIA